ncbi:hypothetical protein Godav_003286 [Gossypium davidsonii]|uniref:Uncharacterized protein n=2 Tax=Gossypium TaxID=3633 RepID=A0A7J8SYQ3_GOSDV|nr:hypothetical protein [Gossypium davidsonii]MBA0666982.1 hypothetical protein [Gossypium klotzschianum]
MKTETNASLTCGLGLKMKEAFLGSVVRAFRFNLISMKFIHIQALAHSCLSSFYKGGNDLTLEAVFASGRREFGEFSVYNPTKKGTDSS